jgi:phosphoacetylglucosamine mutase
MGIMVTASHNDESYNGIKVSNPDGSMIDSNQEAIMVKWVNECNGSKWKSKLDSYQESTSTDTYLLLHVGGATRSHSERWTNLAIQGAQTMGITIRNHGILTTPMLHHVVLHFELSFETASPNHFSKSDPCRIHLSNGKRVL